MFSTLRTIETEANQDGSATSHVLVRCTLSDIAQATGLRVEDAAFAMNECGMLERRQRVSPTPDNRNKGKDESADPDDQEEYIVISREMVEAIAKERNVKKMCMDLAHVLL